MRERLYQLGFGEEFQRQRFIDVTPPNFAGLEFDKGEPLGRFVREVTDPVVVTSPSQVAEYLMERIYNPFEAFDQEELHCLLLNTKNRITHEVMVYRGTVNTAMVREAEIFKEAVRVNAPAIIISHLHPSGDPAPSPEDVRVTKQIVDAGKLLDVAVLDHIVIGRNQYVSMKEKGVGFDR